MNDDTVQFVAWWALALAIVPCVIFTIVNGVIRTEPCELPRRPWPWRWQIALSSIAITAWLWSPWMALGLVKIHRANWNTVNYVNRPDTVIPEPGKTIHAGAVEAPVQPSAGVPNE